VWDGQLALKQPLRCHTLDLGHLQQQQQQSLHSPGQASFCGTQLHYVSGKEQPKPSHSYNNHSNTLSHYQIHVNAVRNGQRLQPCRAITNSSVKNMIDIAAPLPARLCSRQWVQQRQRQQQQVLVLRLRLR
jgi:hypothetical protein